MALVHEQNKYKLHYSNDHSEFNDMNVNDHIQKHIK